MPWFQAAQAIVEEPPLDSSSVSIPESPVPVLLPWLYLAPMRCVLHQAESLAAAPKKDESEGDGGFTHVVSTNAMLPHVAQELYYELLSVGIHHLYSPALDILSYDIMGRHWDECRDFLQQALEQQQQDETDEDRGPPTKVLVHCEAGMNRSGTIVAAAMLYFGDNNHHDDDRTTSTLFNVLRHLKRQRGRVMTNTSFLKQIIVFAESLGKLDPLPASFDSVTQNS